MADSCHSENRIDHHISATFWPILQWRSHTSGVRGVHTPCQENTYFWYVISQRYRPRKRRQSHKWIWLTSKIYDWRATWSRLGETKWLAVTSRVNDWRRGGVQWLLCNCPMHEWHQSLQRFSYLVLFICNVYIVVFNLQWRYCIVYVSYARTVVRECCKGDDESLWERGKFDPPPPLKKKNF